MVLAETLHTACAEEAVVGADDDQPAAVDDVTDRQAYRRDEGLVAERRGADPAKVLKQQVRPLARKGAVPESFGCRETHLRIRGDHGIAGQRDRFGIVDEGLPRLVHSVDRDIDGERPFDPAEPVGDHEAVERLLAGCQQVGVVVAVVERVGEAAVSVHLQSAENAAKRRSHIPRLESGEMNAQHHHPSQVAGVQPTGEQGRGGEVVLAYGAKAGRHSGALPATAACAEFSR